MTIKVDNFALFVKATVKEHCQNILGLTLKG
jgi:hypothetical protein